MTLFYILFSILVLQRVAELAVAGRNEGILLRRGAVEYDRGGYRLIVLMHVLFIVSIPAEYVFLNRGLNRYSYLFLAVFIAAQGLRYWAIATLGVRWNTKILVIPGIEPVQTGPYKYFTHPNYIAVVIEILVFPLIFSCYATSAIFSILNFLALRRRIRIEEKALGIARGRLPRTD